jgi:uncharacterized repeat protein (TIGR01451 family)
MTSSSSHRDFTQTGSIAPKRQALRGLSPVPHPKRRPLRARALLLAACGLVGSLLVQPALVHAQEALQPGDAVVTRFSGTVEEGGRQVIDPDGAVVSTIDLGQPGGPPRGEHWFNELQRGAVTAAEIGQVFGVALDDATPANIYLTATSAFGLHRNADNSGWMAGQWGEGAGPGTIWKLNAANGYRPEVFAEIDLGGRANSGAALGNIAFDRWNRQLYVSDLETGMIHRLRLSDGAELGTFDHGVDGRDGFVDAFDGELQSLPPVEFDPASSAQIDGCPTGDFSRSPSCWNFADFRRRVWGLGVRRDGDTGEVRLYYALWSSQGFGNPAYFTADEDEKLNSVWSVGIAPDGNFEPVNIRREFFLPDFFRAPEAIARAGRSHPVSDIAFPQASEQNVMLLAERGGIRNLGLAAPNAFANPNEARVLRYELNPDGFWWGAGRYDVGFYDRAEDGPPYIRAGSAGGVSFGPGYLPHGVVSQNEPDGSVWMTGDGLCSPRGLCFDSSSGEYNDSSQVNGLQGRASEPFEAFEPVTAFKPYPAPGPATPPTGPEQSYMVDVDVNTDPAGVYIEADRTKNDATRIGDVAVFEPLPAGGELPELEEPGDMAGWPEGLPPEGWIPAPPPPDGWFPPPPFPLDTDLAIRKEGPAECQEGVDCTYVITIRNVGAAVYTGPLAITDTMPVGATLSSTSPGWNCVPTGGSSFRCITNAAAFLPPGATAAIEVNVLLPATIPGPSVTNCVIIDWFEMGTDDGPGDGNDDDCVTTPVIEGFNLSFGKGGPAVCAENATCTFGLGVINFGPGEYNGMLSVRDQLPPGATLQGNTGGWSCVQTGGEVVCNTVGDVPLPAFATYGFNLAIKLPDGIAPTVVQNCGEINWGEMGADDGTPDPHPDDDCHSVNVIDGAAFHDLQLSKAGPAHCDIGGNCEYSITVRNHGPGDYNGNIVIQDTPPAGYTYVSGTPGWACVPGPLIGCSLLGGPHLLPPGDSRTMTLTLAVPPGATADFNCANIAWGFGGMPADDNPPPGSSEHHDDACVLTQIGDGFDISIDKTGPLECFEGALCSYDVTLTNNGPGFAAGVLAIEDILPAGATLESVDGGWTCLESVPGLVSCNIPALFFAPGLSFDIGFNVRLPDPVIGPTVENCARLNWGPMPAGMYQSTFTSDDDPANDGPVCVTTPVLAADLAPWGATTCELGKSCPLDVRVENRGGRLFKGAAGLVGTLDPAVAITSVQSQTPGFTCSVTGNGTYECTGQDLTLKPGSSADVRLTVDIPANFPHKRIIHRKEMSWPDLQVKDEKPENDRHTSTIMIIQPEESEEPEAVAETEDPVEPQQPPEPQDPPEEPRDPVTPPPPPAPSAVQAADLSLRKTAMQRNCVSGQRCDFEVTVTNNGAVAYNGPLRVNDVADPSGRLIASGPRPWRCSARRGSFNCTHPVTTLAPGESRTLALGLRPVRSGARSLENCARLAWVDADRVRAVQHALNTIGFPSGRPDGRVGPNTRRAVRGFQEAAGLPVTGRIDDALIRRLFVAWGDGDAYAANDNECVAVGLQQPIEPPPVCARGETLISASRVGRLRGQGWLIAPVTRGGVTIYCGTPPQPAEPPLACPPGYDAYQNKNRIPRGWEVVRRTRGNQVLYCARPQPVVELQCPRGYEAFRNKNRIPRGWEVIRRTGGNQVLYCARPRPVVDLSCPSGYKPYPNRNQVPRGWEVLVQRGNGQVLYCARPRQQTEECPRGFQQVSRAKAKELAKQGWEIRQVGNLMCARRGRVETPRDPTPACSGGRTWDPKRRECVCPSGTHWVPNRGRCLKVQLFQPEIQPQTRPQQLNPQLQLRPPSWVN